MGKASQGSSGRRDGFIGKMKKVQYLSPIV
jgi:hypothetical protein